MEEEGGDDTARDAGHQVPELDGAEVVEEGGGAAAVTHHGWLDLSVAQGAPGLHHHLPIFSSLSTETVERIKNIKTTLLYILVTLTVIQSRFWTILKRTSL